MQYSQYKLTRIHGIELDFLSSVTETIVNFKYR